MKKLLLVLALAVGFVSCEKEEVLVDNTVIEVVDNKVSSKSKLNTSKNGVTDYDTYYEVDSFHRNEVWFDEPSQRYVMQSYWNFSITNSTWNDNDWVVIETNWGPTPSDAPWLYLYQNANKNMVFLHDDFQVDYDGNFSFTSTSVRQNGDGSISNGPYTTLKEPVTFTGKVDFWRFPLIYSSYERIADSEWSIDIREHRLYKHSVIEDFDLSSLNSEDGWPESATAIRLKSSRNSGSIYLIYEDEEFIGTVRSYWDQDLVPTTKYSLTYVDAQGNHNTNMRIVEIATGGAITYLY